MAEMMTVNLERLFFSYILENPEQIEKVEPSNFKKDEIQFVYNIVREEYLNSKKRQLPTHKQIWAMVESKDEEGKITSKIVKNLLTADTSDVEEEWLERKFKAWKLSNATRSRVMESLEIIRNVDDLDYDNVSEIAGQLKNVFENLNLIDDDDDDLGDSFFDPEAHKQDVNVLKVPTGWSSMDNILSGGWDLASLNVIMGETNIGKSMWLHNIAANAVKAGKNVAVVTLEMAKQKCIKRMGSMLLGIHPSQYNDKSRDTQYIQTKLNQFKSSVMTSDIFEGKSGELYVKKYNTSSCTVTDLDNYITKLNQKLTKNVDMVIIDYLNIMGLEKGLENIKSNLYMKGKHIAEGLRFIGDKHNCAVITATQTDKSVWGASDIKLDSIPESKAVAETADSLWAIIRTNEMHRQNLYRLKILKLRDGEHKTEQIKFNFKPETLTMENDVLVN